MTPSTAKVCLINQNLRLSSPKLFNDPFDVSTVLRISFTLEQMSKELKRELATLINIRSSPDVTQNDTLRAVLEYCATLTPEQRESLASSLERQKLETNDSDLAAFRDFQKTWEAMIPKTRILSLTEENDNPVMWSSYASNYTGVVLQMECIDIYDSVLLLAAPVVYSDELPTIGSLEYWVKMTSGQEPFDYEKVFGTLELTKATKWSYEKEWRVVSFEKRSVELYTDYKMHPRTFSRIYFGKDISKIDRDDLLALITHDLSHMEAYEMHLDHYEHRLSFRRIKTT